MPKISLWKPQKGVDYDYIDQLVQEYFEQGATGVYLHKYLGPKVGTGDANTSTVADGDPISETTIGDVLFLENRDRKYDKNVYELRGSYDVVDNEFDLTQFGIFLTNDTLFISFHYNDMIERLGRKIMSGDVIELPHLRDDTLLDPEKNAINRFYVVEDAGMNAKGYGPKWWGHIWRTKVKLMPDSSEFRDILGTGENKDDLRNDLSSYNKELAITDALVNEAARNVKYDPKFFAAHHLYVENDENGIPLVGWHAGDGIPPNGKALYGTGDSFPIGMPDGEFFLRTDFSPPTLFMKNGSTYVRIEADLRKLPWTGENQVLDSFFQNDNVTTNSDGTTEPEKQAISKAVRPKTDY